MARPHARTFRPDAGTAGGVRRLYREYLALHDYFGRGGNDVMKRLRAIRDEASAAGLRTAEPVSEPAVPSTGGRSATP